MEVQDFFDKHYKLFMAGVIVVILFCIGIIITVPVAKESGKPTILEISVAPTTAKIEIDGKEYRNGTYNFQPGTYKATVSQDGFTAKEVNVDVKNHDQSSVVTYLVNQTEGMDYYERNVADIEMLRLNNNDENPEVKEFLDSYDRKLSIRDKLPMNASFQKSINIIALTIADGSASSKCHYAFCLRVIGGKKYARQVKDFLKKNNYNYDDYEVIYD